MGLFYPFKVFDKIMNHKVWIVFLFFIASLPFSLQAESRYGDNERETLIRALHAVSEDNITSWMLTLTSPEMRGRLAGDIGYDRAADWAAGKLESWGLQPFFPEKGFFQEFDQPYTLVKDKGLLQMHIPMGENEITKTYEYGKDYYPWAMSGSGEVYAEAVYVGYGISAPELGYDDYAGVDVEGKIVICELGIPYGGSDPDSLQMWQPHQDHDQKVRTAVEQGAKGMIMAYHLAGARPTVDEDFVFLAAGNHVIEDFFKGTGHQLDDVRKTIRSTLSPHSFPTGKKATLALTTEYYPDGTTSNVVAMIEGQHPELKNEYLIIGAHLDHLGMMPVLFPGALDNASGVSLALGIAKALSEAEVSLDRSLIILLFGAEEVGLVGATHFVENFPHPKEQIKMLINLDMVGRGNSFFAYTPDPWKELLPFLERNNEQWVHRPMNTRTGEWRYAFRPRTDGAVFSNHKIPTIHFGTRGATTPTRYHVPEDDMEQIEVEIMRDVIKLLTMSLIELGNAREIPLETP